MVKMASALLADEAILARPRPVPLCHRSLEAIGLPLFDALLVKPAVPPRRNADGRYVPLDEQDTGRRNAIMITEADGLLAGGRLRPLRSTSNHQATFSPFTTSGGAPEPPDWTALNTYDASCPSKHNSQRASAGARRYRGGARPNCRIAPSRTRWSSAISSAISPIVAVRAHLLAEAGEGKAPSRLIGRRSGHLDSSVVRRTSPQARLDRFWPDRSSRIHLLPSASARCGGSWRRTSLPAVAGARSAGTRRIRRRRGWSARTPRAIR